ncbi:MAG: hypothetical protein K9M07_05845 [Simkaniaceae bacterium]|nr:hypothetical protein [Simkaniaceae bacterium]
MRTFLMNQEFFETEISNSSLMTGIHEISLPYVLLVDEDGMSFLNGD